MSGEAILERRLRISGTLIILGLIVEAVCLLWSRPLAFVLFIGFGGAFLTAGILFYLYSLVSKTPRLDSQEGREEDNSSLPL
jgi:hypothetical protein